MQPSPNRLSALHFTMLAGAALGLGATAVPAAPGTPDAGGSLGPLDPASIAAALGASVPGLAPGTPSPGNAGTPATPTTPITSGTPAPQTPLSTAPGGIVTPTLTVPPSSVPGASPSQTPAVTPTTPAATPAPGASDPLQLERQRVTTIEDRASAFPLNASIQQLRARAVREGWSVDQFSGEAMKALATASPPVGAAPGAGITVGLEQREKKRSALATILACRAMGDVDSMLVARSSDPRDVARVGAVARALGFSSAEQASQQIREARASGYMGMRLSDMAMLCVAESRGVGMEQVLRDHGGVTPQLYAAAFHSSSDFPLLLANTANKTLLAAYEMEQTSWQEFCGIGTANDYKEQSQLKVSELGNLRLVPEGQRASETSRNEERETLKVDAYARVLSFTYQMLRNDDLGAFTDLSRQWGEAARRLPDQLVFALLAQSSYAGPNMSDGQPLFHSSHGNIITSSALGYASFVNDWTAFRRTPGFGPDAEIIEMRPAVCLVPVELEIAAQDIAMQDYVPGVPATPSSATQRNALKGRFRVAASARLPAASTRRWWFADPATRPCIKVNFLDGQQTPVLTPIGDGDPLNFRVQATVFGVGVGAVDYRTAKTNAGV